MTKTSFKKGEEFEKFVEDNLFPEKDYILIHRTNNFEQNKTRYSEDTKLPDFKFKCKKTFKEFYIEAKFRSKFNDKDKLTIMNLGQRDRFNTIQDVEKLPVYIIIGYEGTPSNPKYLSLIPLNDLKYLELFSTFLKKYNISRKNINSETLNFNFNTKINEEDVIEKKFKKPNSRLTRKIILGISLIGFILIYINYQSIYKSIVPTMPVIVSSSSNNSSTKFFDYSTTVVVNVMNKGGDGFIAVKTYVNQEGEIFEKSKEAYFKSYETKQFEFIFDEVKLMKKNPTYEVKTFRIGSFSE